MMKNYKGLTAKIIKLLEEDPGQPVKDLARKLGDEVFGEIKFLGLHDIPERRGEMEAPPYHRGEPTP